LKHLILLITSLCLLLLSSSLAPVISARGSDRENNVQSNNQHDTGQFDKAGNLGITVWARTYGGSGPDNPRSIIQVSDGGYVIAGEKGSTEPGPQQGWLFHTDPKGNILWQKAYDFAPASPGIRHFGAATGVVQAPDNGIVAVGYWGVSDRFGCCYSWIAKLDKNNGNVLWAREIGNGYPSSIDAVTEGGYIASGTTVTQSEMQPHGWIIRLDADGKIVWGNVYAISDRNDSRFRSVHETPDHGFIATGSSGDAHSMLWVLKTDHDGKLLWQKTYDGPVLSHGYSIVNTPAKTNGYVVLGSRYDGNPAVQSSWILQLSNTGGIVWENSYGKRIGNTIIRDSKDGYVTALEDGSILRIDSHGNVSWHRKYADPGHAPEVSIIQTKDSGFLMARRPGTSDLNGGVWLVKTNSQGYCCKSITSNLLTNVTATHSTVNMGQTTAQPLGSSSPNTWYVTTITQATTRIQCTGTMRR
jgi:hypothetical protein